MKMDRKPPYHHTVSGHYRDGKYIDDYERGKGKKPSNPGIRVKGIGRALTVYHLVFHFRGGETESYNEQGTLSGAVRSGLSRIQRAEVPRRVNWELVR